MRKLSKLITALFLFGTVALVGNTATANGNVWGHVCDVNHYPMSSWAGTNGYLEFDVYAQPYCSAGYLGTYYFMTSGNAYPGANYFSADSLNTHLRTLTDYIHNGRSIYVVTATPDNVVNNIWYGQ